MTDLPVAIKRGTRVLYRRSILCGRAPEFGVVVKRHKDEANFTGWYHVRDEDRPDSRGISEHESMIVIASEGWQAREVERLRADAETAARRDNESLSFRYQAEALRACADRLASL